jgi:hypothetical protein
MLTITPINAVIVNKALQSSFSDFEDALQYFSAITVSSDIIIVTRDINDFLKSDVQVMTSDDFVNFFK